MAETRYHHVSLDPDTDLTGQLLEVSLDQATWTPAEPTGPPPEAAGLPGPPTGMVRYWWRVLIGPGQPLDPTGHGGPIYGRMASTPEQFYPTWPLDADPSLVPDFAAYADWPVAIPDGDRHEFARLTVATQQLAKAQAVQTLRRLTAYMVGGPPVTVRPCVPPAGDRTWRGGRDRFYPVLASGQWLNIPCGHGHCYGHSGLWLPPPVSNVRDVWVHGVQLPPTAYRLSGAWLYRTDGRTWPLHQNLAVGPHDRAGFSITYTPGWPVTGEGAYAAGILAVEYARAATGGKCRLPRGTTGVTRQGVSMTLDPAEVPDGLTGITEVDSFVARWNPHAVKVAPSVWSPDLPQMR